MSKDRVDEAHSSKPDPEEPWRYVSPCCRVQVSSYDSSMWYYCNNCMDGFKKDDLIDKKDL